MLVHCSRWSTMADGDTHADDLPEEAEDEMGFAFGEVVGVDVDDVAADRLGRIEGQRQVLVLRVQRQVLRVDRPLVDRVRAREVHHFAAKIKTSPILPSKLGKKKVKLSRTRSILRSIKVTPPPKKKPENVITEIIRKTWHEQVENQ